MCIRDRYYVANYSITTFFQVRFIIWYFVPYRTTDAASADQMARCESVTAPNVINYLPCLKQVTETTSCMKFGINVCAKCAAAKACLVASRQLTCVSCIPLCHLHPPRDPSTDARTPA